MQISTSFSVQNRLAAELLGWTILRLFPNVLLAGGGVNSLGFFCDFILEQPLTDSMRELIEIHLRSLIKEGHEVRSLSMMRENAQVLFEHHHQPLLAYRASKCTTNIIDLVQVDQFYGLCPELCLTSTEESGYIKLLDCLEVNQWINEEKVCLTRLIGVSQPSAKDLKKFVKNYESFLKRKDHRVLGPKLNLFRFSPETSSLEVYWYPKGAQLRHTLKNWLEQQLHEKIAHVLTPSVIKQDFLAKKQQKLDAFVFDGQEYQLSPSPIRQHLELFKDLFCSREELPWQVMEYAPLYQFYPESQRWGLFWSCYSETDHATIACLKKEVVAQLISSLHFIEQIIRIFSFEAQWYLVVSRQRNLKGRQEQESLGWLKQSIQMSSYFYPFASELEEEEGEGTRLELRVRDVIGREWPTSVVSVVPFALINKSLSNQQIQERSLTVLTRRVWGSLERFIALLIEKYEGVFPLWLSPEQVRVLLIGESNLSYAREIVEKLQQKKLRVRLDKRLTKLSERIHEAEKENIPYLILIGDQERERQRIKVRTPGQLHQGQWIELEEFLDKLYRESLCPDIKPFASLTAEMKGHNLNEERVN